MVLYLVLPAAVDRLKASWRRYRQARQHRRIPSAELARIDREAVVSIERIGAAFMMAQRLLREEAAAMRERR